MANISIHLAIAKKYLEKNPALNYQDVIDGTFYPDSIDNDDESHYTDLLRNTDTLSHVRGKVRLYHFLKEHKNLNDFEKGWFLHLITDYLFFDECFTTEYLKETSYEKFCQELYFAYDCISEYLEEKYNITMDDYKKYPDAYYPGIRYKECILKKENIDVFIERVSSIDLDKYITKIKRYKRNIKP